MRKVNLLICFLILVSFSCEKDDSLSAPENLMIPLKGEIIEIGVGPVLSCFDMPYNSQYLDLSGTLTNFGDTEGGFANLFCPEEMQIIDAVPTIVVSVDGQFKDLDNNILTYEGELRIVIHDDSNERSNHFSITGGSGPWEDASGHFTANFEPLPDGTLLYTVDGLVTSPTKD